MYEIKADTHKNRLYIIVDGTISFRRVEHYNNAMEEAVAMLKPGFTSLLDLRKALVFDMVTMKQLQGTKRIAIEAGLKKSAMVLRSPALKMQLNRIYKELGPQDVSFNDINEAIAFLDE